MASLSNTCRLRTNIWVVSNVMGGGGGKDGFKTMLSHFSGPVQGWLSDMNAHAFDYKEPGIDRLNTSVQEMLKDHDLETVESQRDDVLIELLNLKKSAPALV